MAPSGVWKGGLSVTLERSRRLSWAFGDACYLSSALGDFSQLSLAFSDPRWLSSALGDDRILHWCFLSTLVCTMWLSYALGNFHRLSWDVGDCLRFSQTCGVARRLSYPLIELEPTQIFLQVSQVTTYTCQIALTWRQTKYSLLSAAFCICLRVEHRMNSFAFYYVAELRKRWQSFRKIWYCSIFIANAELSIFEIMRKITRGGCR